MKYIVFITVFLFSFIAQAVETNSSKQEGDWEFLNKWMLVEYASEGNLDGVKELIEEYNVDPNYMPEEGEYAGMTALMYAADKGYYGIVKYLVKKGADIDLYNSAGFQFPIHFALSNNHYEIADYFLENGMNAEVVDTAERPLLMFVNTDSDKGFSFFKKLVEKYNLDINSTDKYGWSILRTADNYKTVKYLVEKGVDIDFAPPQWCSLPDGKTALMAFSERNDKEIIDYLIEEGANTNYQSLISKDPSCGGETALMMAASNCAFESIELLLDKGANIQIKNYNEETAYDYAKKAKCEKNILGLLR